MAMPPSFGLIKNKSEEPWSADSFSVTHQKRMEIHAGFALRNEKVISAKGFESKVFLFIAD